ncbi:hypothetical protein Alches_04940 [Alicyclobacillus hesperidum subsp. aegles]|uniref:phosphorylase family protein n=1 Tax=Alicyclobacillus hesperidum TaxID=89784 RepID=UPI0007193719|nr:hypothetical protein [Alicyclobacillus hesperidum]KRW92692.1 hypothetical protein SD51_01955 [Alicyclobacillus tengchongensis]GLG00455.1 hypothetical protein Alches_04940 [Alicyclobacillus hesperidum subsp. aegles]
MASRLVLTALAFEANALRPLRSALDWGVIATGVGPARGRATAEQVFAAARPAFALGVGVCGALSADARRGEIALPQTAVSDAGAVERIAPLPEPLLEAVQMAARKVGVGVRADQGIASVGRIAASPADKRELALRVGARWVDQETFAWAQAARSQGVPFYAIRVVLDTASDQLPSWHPGTWGHALRLPLHALRARRILQQIGRELACLRW